MANISDLIQRARTIRIETKSKKNTADRIGGLLLDIVRGLGEAQVLKKAQYGGIVATSADVVSDYAAKGYSGPYFYLVGSSLSSLVVYQYAGSGTPAQAFGGVAYDFADYSEALRRIGDLEPKINNIGKVLNKDNETDTFYIVDNNKKVIAKFDANGLSVTAAKIKDGNGNLADLLTMLNGKVSAVQGKGLSTNDYTNEEKEALDQLKDIPDVLNTEDFNNTFYITDGQRNVLAKFDSNGLSVNAAKIKDGNGNLADLLTMLNGKVSAVQGKGLSTNDYTNEEKETLDQLKDIPDALNTKDLNNTFYITDGQQNVLAKFDSNGLSVNAIKLKDSNGDLFDLLQKIEELSEAQGGIDGILSILNDAFYITDRKGYVKFKVSAQGVEWPHKDADIRQIVQETIAQSNKTMPILPYDVCMHITDGQSLSVIGTNGGALDYTPAVMFTNGIRVDYTAEQAADATYVHNFYGDEFEDVAGDGFEGINKRLMYMWNKLIRSENGQNPTELGFQLISVNTGISGSSIAGLSKGTYSYTRTLQAVENGKRIANSEGKTFGVASFVWMQGESNYRETKSGYYTALKQLFVDFNADIKAITGQTEDVQFFCYQLCSYQMPWSQYHSKAGNGVEQAILQLCKDEANVHLGTPMYNWKYGDELHPDYGGKPYFAIGALNGVKIKRLISDNNLKDFNVKGHKVMPKGDGTYYVEIQFNVPEPPLQFDTQTLWYCNPWGAIQNMGFSMKRVLDMDLIDFKGTSFHTLATAIASVPLGLRKSGAKIKYRTAYGSTLVTNTDEYDEITYVESMTHWVQRDAYPTSDYKAGDERRCSLVDDRCFRAKVDHAGYPVKRIDTWAVKEFYQGDPTSNADWTNQSNWRDTTDDQTELVLDVRIARGTSVVVHCSENPTHLLMEYAQTGCMGGGNLRDSQGNTITCDVRGEDIPIHNWCPMFLEILD